MINRTRTRNLCMFLALNCVLLGYCTNLCGVENVFCSVKPTRQKNFHKEVRQMCKFLELPERVSGLLVNNEQV